MKNSKRRAVIALFFIFNFSVEIRNLWSNELSVDKRIMQLDDTLTITITLEDGFAGIDSIKLPVRNLVIEGAPSVSREFDLINGQTSRRKTFQYTAHPGAPGSAVIGPVTLHGSGGQVETLAPISIQVLPDAAAGTNDPAKILRELIATNRDPIFLVASADPTAVFEGQEVIVTWWLYNATSVQQYAIGEIPKLEDFWAEELDVRGEQPVQLAIDGIVVQKLPIRRVALFPLRSGFLTIPAMGVNASILKRVRTGNPFDLFEGMEVDVHRRSSPISIRARAVPPGPPVAAVGDVTLRCGLPVQRNGGPVAMSIVLNGRANLRGAAPPAFERTPKGTLQIIDKATMVDRRHDDAMMTRRWEYLIFPTQQGPFTIPALDTTVLTPLGQRQHLRCEATTLMVSAASPEEPPPPLAERRDIPGVRAIGIFLAAIAAAVVIGVIALARLKRSRRIRERVRGLVRPTAAETRSAVDDYLASHGIEPSALLREPSERGDAYRSLRSLLDALERDRISAGEREIAQRVRDLVTA